MRVRFVTPSLPWPPDQGARIRGVELLSALPEDVDVELWYVARPDEPTVPDRLRERCTEVRRFARSTPPLVERWALPRAAQWFYSRELRDAFEAGASDVDLVHLDEPSLVPLWPDPAPGLACLAHHKLESDLSYALASAGSGTRAARHLLDAARWERLENDAAERVPSQVVCSSLDADRLRARFPNLAVTVVENGVDPAHFEPRATTRDANLVLFLGSLDYGPNRHGLRTFLREVWPLLRRERPRLRFAIVGRGEADDLRASCAFDSRIEWVGAVADPRPWIARCAAFVVPLAIGGGTRLKLVEALAMQASVVTTPVGAEGLDVEDGVHLRSAELGPDFARAVLEAVDARRPDPLAVRGRELVLERYTWSHLAARLAATWHDRIGTA